MSVITLPFTPSAPAPGLRLVRDWARLLPAQPWLHSWHSMRPQFSRLDASGRVQELVDRSGKARSFLQATPALRPTLQENAINGHSAGVFFNHGFNYNGPFPTGAYTKAVVIYVPANTATTAPTVIGHSTTTDTNHRIYLEIAGGRARHQVQNGADAKPNPAAGGFDLGRWHLLLATFDGATGTVKMKIDDNPASVAVDADLKTVQDLPFFLGYGNLPAGAPSAPLDGMMADVMIANIDVTKAGNEAAYGLIREFASSVYGLAA